MAGARGVRSARYAGEKASDEDNNNLLLHNMKFQVKRTCRFRCALCVAQPDGKVLNEVDGICDGMLLHEPLGENGFGYDPVFLDPELGLTAAFPINPLPLPFEQVRVSCRENLSAAVENLIRFYCSVAR